jgi:myo-inositol-1(or 4)-monophosphatase
MTIACTTDLQRAARAAEQAAYAAGTHLQASRSRLAAVVITQRSPAEVAQAIDAEARALIRGVVGKQFPEHRFVGDEAGLDRAARIGERVSPWHDERGPLWVVDPIDGIANYLRGYPQYAVSIALVEAGVAQLGVVYDPCRNEFFGAIRGFGMVLNGEPIRSAKPRAAADSMAATVFPRPASQRMPDYMAELGRMLRGFGGVRRSGSTALELAYLAAGRTDAFWAHDVRPWDTAAGAVLLAEGGALLHARDGMPLLASASVLGCAPHLFEPFLSLLAEP